MEEAEALCSRVGIICAGRLRCLGAAPANHAPPISQLKTSLLSKLKSHPNVSCGSSRHPRPGTLQHLKFKFGDTFFAEIKIPTARHDALVAFMREFSTAKLLEEPWQVPVGGCLLVLPALIELHRAATPTACQPQARMPSCASAASHLTLPSPASETSLGKLIRTLERDKAQVKRQEPRACPSRDAPCFAAWHFGLRRQPDLAGTSLFAIGQEAPASGRMRAAAAERLLFAAPHRIPPNPFTVNILALVPSISRRGGGRHCGFDSSCGLSGLRSTKCWPAT